MSLGDSVPVLIAVPKLRRENLFSSARGKRRNKLSRLCQKDRHTQKDEGQRRDLEWGVQARGRSRGQ